MTDANDESMSESLLAERLRMAVLASDPIPDEVLTKARAAFRLRLPGAALAILSDETETAPTGLRTVTRTRTLTFTGTAATVELEMTGNEITGRLTPPTATRVRLRRPTRPDDITTTDEAGCFALDGPLEGPVSLVIDLPDGAALATSWVNL